MNRRTLTIAISAALVSLVLGYGLLGLAAPDVGASSTERRGDEVRFDSELGQGFTVDVRFPPS